MSMTEVTKVSKAHSRFNSLKTTIPSSLVKEWKLKPGNQLEWDWVVINNKMVMTIKKA
jgi:antitoxin component of MazEF toxin-antitoxin module